MDYRPIGQVIPGTRFIAFKVPLKEVLFMAATQAFPIDFLKTPSLFRSVLLFV